MSQQPNPIDRPRRPRRRRLGRTGAVFAATCAACAIVVPQASALTVKTTKLIHGQVVEVVAANDTTDIVNQLTVHYAENGAGTLDDEYVITDAKATIDVVNGCTKIDAHNASCAAAGIVDLRVALGDGGDSYFGAQVPTDTLVYADKGSDVVFTGPGDDTIYDGSLSSSAVEHDGYYSGAGADRFGIALAGNDTVTGGSGVDTADFSDSATGVKVSLDGKTNDGVGGASGANVAVEHLQGSKAADTLTGNGASNVLEGNGGDDVLAGGGGADKLIGGEGRDTADYSAATSGVMVNLDDGANDGVQGEGDNVRRDVERIKGSAFSDTLKGWVTDNALDGGAGSDLLDGGLGKDWLTGGSQDDTLIDGPGGEADKGDVISPGTGYDTMDYSARFKGVRFDGRDSSANEGEPTELDKATEGFERVIGGSGHDTLSGLGTASVLEGRNGNDVLISGESAYDVLDGGQGADLASWVREVVPVVATLDGVDNDGPDANADGIADKTDVLKSIEGLGGGSKNDKLTGDDGVNRLEGNGGSDKLFGLGSDDVMLGGLGADDHNGGAGTDAVSYADGVHMERVVANIGTGANDGTDANHDGVAEEKDTIRSGVENLTGGHGDDYLHGNSAVNVIDGFLGDDLLKGGLGADHLFGGEGDDNIMSTDGFADSVDCGLGAADVNSYDNGLDTTVDCETAS